MPDNDLSASLVDLVGSRRRHLHALPAEGELLRAIAIGKEAEIANALKPVGKHVKEEARDEFISTEPHRFVLTPPAKRDLAVIDI